MTEPTIDVRRLSAEEMAELMFPITEYAFHASPPLPHEAEFREVILGREGVTYLAAFEGDQAVATIAGTVMTQNVRGAIYDASGVWGVATCPEARRKGHSRRLMAGLLAANHEAQLPLACLYPFRESFYERLGYVTFPLPRIARLKPAALAPLLRQDLGGKVERQLIGDSYDLYRDYVERLMQCVHGLGTFVPSDKTRVQKLNHRWTAFAHARGELVGLMLYELKGEDIGRFTLRATRFYYETPQARYLLLQWIARHVDQASEVEIWLPPYEQPETWLSDLEIRTESQVRAPMCRVVDIARLGGMHTGPGRFAARVHDPLCPWNDDTWQFETVDGVLHASRAARADCDLSIQGLTALVYGTHDPGDFRFRGWGDPSTETQAAMRAMFPPMTPFLHEYF